MPKIKRSRKPPPDGWELIEPTLDELDAKMREGMKICTAEINSDKTKGRINFNFRLSEPLGKYVQAFR